MSQQKSINFEEDDRSKKVIDRRGIEAFLTKIIQDELIDDVAIMDISDGYDYGEIGGTKDRLIKRSAHASTQRKARKKKQGQARRASRRRSPRFKVNGRDDDDDPPRHQGGFNNQAKTREAEITADIEGEPSIIKPSRRNIDRYGKYFPGTNLDTIKKTLDATTQYGTRGAIDGVNL